MDSKCNINEINFVNFSYVAYKEIMTGKRSINCNSLLENGFIIKIFWFGSFVRVMEGFKDARNIQDEFRKIARISHFFGFVIDDCRALTGVPRDIVERAKLVIKWLYEELERCHERSGLSSSLRDLEEQLKTLRILPGNRVAIEEYLSTVMAKEVEQDEVGSIAGLGTACGANEWEDDICELRAWQDFQRLDYLKLSLPSIPFNTWDTFSTDFFVALHHFARVARELGKHASKNSNLDRFIKRVDTKEEPFKEVKELIRLKFETDVLPLTNLLNSRRIDYFATQPTARS